MEKSIKKKVFKLVCAVSVVVFGYWLILSPNGYWQRRAREADEKEYSEKRLLWRKSETMTMQRMLQDLTLLANGDSVMVCEACHLTLSVYRDLIHGKAQPKRLIWANTRYWYMSSIANGREWMQKTVKDMRCGSYIFLSTSLSGVQTDSTKDYRKEKSTSTEATYNEMYPKLGKSADKEFEAWRAKKNKRWIRL